ncbi:MAG TPA: hypothetical protein VD886_00425 [Herpetosiphonaceae bacterium]|nr:hypothetical protein [Herpetosiphonaceae bacterium]
MATESIVVIGTAERRALIKRCLGADAGRIVGEIGDAAALRLVAGLAPDIVVLDGASDTTNPLVALPALAALDDPPLVIALSSGDNPLEHRLLIELGARAVARLERPSSLAAALDLAARGLGGRRREDRPAIARRAA